MYIIIAAILFLSCTIPTHPIGSNFPPPETGSHDNEDQDSPNSRMQRDVRRESSKLNLKALEASDSEDEVRLWVGFGLITPTCFILTGRRGSETAMYYFTESKVRIEPDGKKKYQAVQVAKALKSPESGWKNFVSFLKSKGVDSPLGLSPDIESSPDDDGEAIVIEVKLRGNYNMVFFPTNSKSVDGLKAFEICHRIEEDFGIRMGC